MCSTRGPEKQTSLDEIRCTGSFTDAELLAEADADILDALRVRVENRPGGLKGRGIIPSTVWGELKKPERVSHEFALDSRALFGTATVTQRGRAADGEWFTCYSVVMRPAPPHLPGIHDRTARISATARAGRP